MKPRFEEDRWKAFGGFSRVLVNPVTEVLAGAFGVFLLGVVVWSGLYGTENERANFNVTFVFVTFWVCVPIVSILFGDVFRAFNPWRAIGRAFGGLFGLIAGRSVPAPLAYPEKLGRWPAVAGLAAFLWFELAFGVPFEPVVIIKPARRRDRDSDLHGDHIRRHGALRRREVVRARRDLRGPLQHVLADRALRGARGTLGRRPWLSGAVGWGLVPGSVALVLLLIAGTTYDGAAEGVLAEPIEWLYELINGGGGAEGDVFARRLTATVFMLVTFGIVSGIYWGGIKGMGTEGSGMTTRELGRTFAFCFIPIAFAYTFAHYFSLVGVPGAGAVHVSLVGPAGRRSDYFGTASGTVDLKVISSEFVWYVQVGALVVGHVAALAMGHDKALAVYQNLRRATQSQYWMLALMVSFTVLGLALLSAANQ